MSKGLNELGNTIGLGLGWLRAVAQGYDYSYTKIELGNSFQNNLKKCGNKIRLGLGWLRVVAQGYNYSYNKNAIGESF